MAGEVEEAKAGLVGAPFGDVGDGFAHGVGNVGVAVTAFSQKSEDVEVFLALGEAVLLSSSVFEVLSWVVGGEAGVEVGEGFDVSVGCVNGDQLLLGFRF